MADPIYELENASALRDHPDAELDWLDVALVVSKRRRFVAKVTLICLVLAIAAAFILPAKYTATARVLPPNSSQSSAAMLMNSITSSGMGGSASSMLGGALGVKNPSDVYVAMLKSDTLADRLIDRFNLKKVYWLGGNGSYTETRKKLEKRTDISTGKEGVITIEVEDRSPERARDLAQGYVDELFKLAGSLTVSEGGQRRAFYEKQLVDEKNKLADAEIELKKVQQQTGMIVPSDQARAIIEGVARVRAMISAKEVQIGAMRAFATEQNPEVLQAQRELSELRGQLVKLERDQPGADGSSIVSTGRVPESALEFIRKYRDYKYHETIYELLAKQFELAKLDEAKDYAALQVLDAPKAPDERSKPPRALIVALGLLAGLVAGTVLSVVQEKRALNPTAPGWQKWRKISSYWRKQDRA